MLQVYLDGEAPEDEQLVLEIPSEGLELSVSAAYFALGDDPQRVDPRDLERRVASLLIQWLRRLEGLRANATCYLPFDFDPQYRHIGCFQVKAVDGDQLLVLYGYTAAYAGAPLPPDAALKFDLAAHEFVVDTDYEIFFAPKAAFLAGINQSVAGLLTEPWL